MPRKTDSKNPADWILIAETELEALQLLAEKEIAFTMCRSKLAEILEKVLKAELIRTGWDLVKTHDLLILYGELNARGSDLAPAAKPVCITFAQVYFSARYPGFDLEDDDWPDFRISLKQVVSLLETVKARLSQSS